MVDKPPDRVALGQTEIPPVLRQLAEMLPRFHGADLESQLQTFDTFAAILSPTARPLIAAMLRVAVRPPADSDSDSARRILRAARSIEAGQRATEPYDHAAAMRTYQAEHRGNYPDLADLDDDDADFLAKIEQALSQIAPMARAGWAPALSVERQLRWCRGLALGEAREARPGPFSMGLIATREFDMWGNEPELAGLINEIERLAILRLPAAGETD